MAAFFVSADEAPHPLRRRLLIAGAAALAGACASSPKVAPQAAVARPVWPQPPDRPRYRLEATLRTAADIMGDAAPAGLLRELSGDQGTDRIVFEKPSAVAARNGRVYVTDSVRRRVVAFDVARRRVFAIGVRERGRLAKPGGLALDGQGNLYVADASSRCIQVYDAFGLPLAALGSAGQLERPTGVAVDAAGERIYAIDRASNESDRQRVLVFSKDGALRGEIGRRGQGPGEFNVPVAGAVAADGTLYVLDAGNFRVQAFTAEGRWLRAFARNGVTPGELARPRGIAVDAGGRVYVCDASFGNVQIFAPDGTLLLAVGSAGKQDAPGRYGLAFGVAVDETGRIYVADQLFRKIEVIRPLGEAEGLALPGA